MKYRIPAVALSLVLALGGCRGAEVPAGAADNSETWKIGISFPTTDLIYRETMMELLKEYEKDHPEVDFFMFGHVHVLSREEIDDGCEIIVLGEWIRTFSYAVLDENGLKLLKWGVN